MCVLQFRLAYALTGKRLTVEKLVERVEDTLKLLELIILDLTQLRNALKGLAAQSKHEITVEAVREMLPENLHEAVSVSENSEHVIVNLRRFLKTEAFREIANLAIGRVGGEYISTRKGGYFRIPKKRALN